MCRTYHLIRWLAPLGLAAGLQAVPPGQAPVPTAPVGALEPATATEATEAAEAPEVAPAAATPTPPATPEAPVAALNPYQAIVVRNAFGLKEPPPPPQPVVKEVAPPVNTSALKLTGVTSLLGKRAMFVFNDGKTNRVSDMVREGETDRNIPDLEVLEIDASNRVVKVLFGGQQLTLDFVNNGLRPPTNLVAPGALPGGGMARPGGPPTLPVVGQAGTLAPGNAIAPIQAGATAFNAGGTRAVPTRPNRLGASAAAGSASTLQAPPPVSVEQQVAIFQEQHRVAREQNIELPPAPPAPGLENLGGGFPAPPGMSGPPAFPGQQ
jgi:hypothetical protein